MVLLTGGLFEELPGGSIEERKKMDRLAVTVVAGHSRARVPHIDADVPRMLSVSNNKRSKSVFLLSLLALSLSLRHLQ